MAKSTFTEALWPMLLSHKDAFLGTKLLLMAVLAHFVDCISLCQILKAQCCCLSQNGCCNQPSAPHHPYPLSARPPAHPPYIQSMILWELKKLSEQVLMFYHLKTRCYVISLNIADTLIALFPFSYNHVRRDSSLRNT